jgi:uncharacterized membrane protein
MIDVPIKAAVECTDGPCGQSTTLIVNPVTETVTHVVVKEKVPPHTQRMVPLEQVIETTSESIKLGCTEAEFKQMESFTETQFVKTYYYADQYGWDTMSAWPYSIPQEVEMPMEVEQVPEGKLAIRRGTYVQATDGLIGQVDELLLDPTGHITHLVLREGHLWGQKVLTLPISTVDHIEGDDVYLNVNKQTIESLPAIPVKQRYGLTNSELIILTLVDVATAKEASATLKNLIKKEKASILNVAMLVKDEQGQTSLKELGDIGPKQGALFGAVTGGLIGLLAGPVGAVVGAAAGAATGRAAAKRIDMGLPNEYLKKLQEDLQPGSAAIVALVEQESVPQVAEALAGFGGQLVQQTLTDEVLARLASASGAEVAGTDAGTDTDS